MSMWITLLNILCISLPIIAFASPATVFLPVFCPNVVTNSRVNGDSDATAMENLKNGSSKAVIEMPPLAITTQMLQCFLFAIYARHFRMWTLFIPNTIGFLMGFAWSTLYPWKLSSDFGFLFQWRIQYFFSLFVMALGSMTIQKYPYLSSSIAAIVGVLMCTYPLASMSRAYKENNANLLGSAFMNLAMMTCCSAWVVHSSPLVEFDVFVLVSNFAGVVVQGGALGIRVCIARKLINENELAPISNLSPLL